MADASRTSRRTTFDQVAELYARARPGYPPAVFDDLLAIAALPARARIVEIGPGPGQATVPLAQRGHAIVAVELGERLAGVARERLARFPDVEVVTADFETWRPERAGFDAVVAFSSFHWLAPETRYARAADLLRPGGALAVVSVAHVLPEDGDPFFVDVQADYEAVAPDDPQTRAGAGGPPRPEAVAELSERVLDAEATGSGRFRTIGARRHLGDVTYTADEYLALLATYSGHIALDERTRERLFARIRRRIDARPQRTVRKSSLAMLWVAERR